jgi:DNA polymerase III alpha subunit
MYLNCHTAFSFKYGTMPVQQLFDEAKRCGVHKLVLTEINNTASYIELLRICQNNRPLDNGLTRYGTRAYTLDVVVGVEFRHNDKLRYVAIARNNKGFDRPRRQCL